MKTYTTASNARRAAKAQIKDIEAPVEGQHFAIEGSKAEGFYWRRVQAEAAKGGKVVAEAPVQQELPAVEPKAEPAPEPEAPVVKLDLPISEYEVCPKCGSEELWAGVVEENGVLDDATADDVGGCHACGWETKGNHKARRKGAVAAVWEICEANKDLKRKEVISICVAQGLNYYTARTQYQEWFKATKNSQK